MFLKQINAVINYNSLLTLPLPESVTFKTVLSFEPVDEILWCDHSNETSLAVLSHGTIYMNLSILQN